MTTIILYKYQSEKGFTVSPEQPACSYEVGYRLIADENKALTRDGVELCPCVDVESVAGWYETDILNEPNEPELETEDMRAALNLLEVNIDG